MIFILVWLIAMGTSELLLWSYSYLHILSPVIYVTLCLMYLYQRKKIRHCPDLSINEQKIRVLRLGIVFLIAMLIMLALTVHINVLISLYGNL
ncbi:hypothetical protein QFI91_17855 [Raoultella sp. WB_B2P2-3]|uniref:Uncharacterized protein n=1 Tax=Raoultella scottii TaxID=3040937 RepID=A0ABU8ZBM5_9ENTR|nr:MULTISPECIES: hypothetical protein [Enterobacteriaceae]MVT01695.1 hypothetical protein [Raoultella sp. 10-1]PAC14225.1 hypothetical protein CD006_03265 [Enterobacter sp. 10-1]